MVTAIFIRGWFILMITVNLLSVDAQQAVTKISKKCLSGSNKCYTLYRGDLTWQEAYDECLRRHKHRNQHLATIQDVQTQSIMQQFAIDQVYPEGAAHAWVAGRRSDDMTWRHLNGSAFNYTGTIFSEWDSSRLCMSLNGESGLSADDDLHWAVPCDSKTAYKAVCQYDPPGGGCPDDNMTILQPTVNKCNTVSSQRYKSWHDARQHCQNQGWQLAHIGAGSWDFYRKLTVKDKPEIRDNALWIGVQRRSWVWKAAELSEIYPAVTYWRKEEGVSSGEDCMYIRLKGRGPWADKHCDATSGYFICEGYHNQPAHATETTLVTILTTKTETVTIQATNTEAASTETANTKTISPTESQHVMIYMIVGVVGGFLVAVIIIVTVVCVRRRKRKGGTTAEYVNSDTGPPIDSPHADTNSGFPQPYAEFTAESRPTEDSYDVPLYEEAEAVQTDKLPMLEIYDNVPDVKAPGNPGLSRVDPGHVVTEEGDVYALPMKNQDTTLDDDLEIVDNEMYGDI